MWILRGDGGNLKNNLWGWKGGQALGGDRRGARAGEKEWRD